MDRSRIPIEETALLIYNFTDPMEVYRFLNIVEKLSIPMTIGSLFSEDSFIIPHIALSEYFLELSECIANAKVAEVTIDRMRIVNNLDNISWYMDIIPKLWAEKENSYCEYESGRLTFHSVSDKMDASISGWIDEYIKDRYVPTLIIQAIRTMYRRGYLQIFLVMELGTEKGFKLYETYLDYEDKMADIDIEEPPF